MGRSDVIFSFDDITWAAAQQRGMCFPQDRVALALIDDERIGKLLICDQPRSAPVKLAKGLLRGAEPFPASDRVRHHQPLRLRRRDPVRLGALERYYSSYGRRLQRVAERCGMEEPAVITAHPFVAAFAALEWAGPVTLLATDDWAVHPAYQRWHPAYRLAYERISAQGTRVCAVTEAIVERISPRGPTAVVPNGVDPAQWLDIAPPPEWMAKLPEPRFFYVGTLDSRLDTGAVLDVARAWPEGTIVLAGPVADHAHLATVEDAPNVFLAGTVSRVQVAALAHTADACLLPHHRLPLTEAMSPLKIYEYLAGGRPVAATDLPPVRGIEGPVSLAPPGGDFVAAVRRALETGPMDEPTRQRFVERNSWTRRCAEVLALALGE
jgi:teichuronic acid biosynthesis glycosyltransferase TuaH